MNVGYIYKKTKRDRNTDACTFSPYPRSFVIISLSVCSTLMHRRSSFSSSSCLVCLISLVRDRKGTVKDVDIYVCVCVCSYVPFHVSYKATVTPVGLLWYKSATFTLPAGVGVFREEQLWTMQDVYQHWQFSLNQWSQAVLQRRHYVLQWNKNRCSGTLLRTDSDVFVSICEKMAIYCDSSWYVLKHDGETQSFVDLLHPHCLLSVASGCTKLHIIGLTASWR